MRVRLKKIGNSRGFTIPPQVLEGLGWTEDTELSLAFSENGIEFTKSLPDLDTMIRSVKGLELPHEFPDRNLRGKERGE